MDAAQDNVAGCDRAPDADTRALLHRVLATHGYRIVEAADGREAVEVALSECPDLVVMDLNRCGQIAVVAVTAFDTYGMRDAAMEVGCNAYLLKPLALDELEAVIAGLLTG